jgi:hypothetical protein
MADRKESAADVKISVDEETDVTVERLSYTKEIEISTIYGSGRTLPDGYSVDQISYQGTMELQGNKLDLEQQLFDGNGIPEEATITVTHFNGQASSLDQVLATSEGWELNAGETTTTTFEFIAMGKSYAGDPDQEP